MHVIVGASLTGAKAAEELRAAGYTGPIMLIGEESERPYERPPLSKEYLLGTAPREKAYVHDAGWYAAHDVDLRLGVRATGLDPAAHTVILAGGESVTYDRLLLATGSRVRLLDVPGAEHAGVRYLRSLPDADRLLDDLPAARRVVVIGAGWIGLEATAAARAHGAEVTVVEQDRAPLRRILGDEIAEVFTALHRAHGVTFRFGAAVREIRDSAVVLTDGTELPADLVLAGVGVTPATELAERAGLAVDNGVVVDAGLRTSDPDIFAAGDVAAIEHPLLGRRIRVEHWANAQDGGRAAARAMLGEAVRYDRVPYFFTDQYERGMEYAGWVETGGYERVVLRGDPAGPFLAFWVAGGHVLAGLNADVWEVQDDIQALVRAGWAGRAVDEQALADPAVSLAELL
ncbi:NAD(P)/FAD-dependent oxidoreductase [Actinoplanes aureus]|uniref:FAD-dependent oxidoreductase n=1 Tax=Actinoplanes aureus TaxID=2792083 RepID=A0A931G0H1_9ACTN|nr:FAD-dependent oxidoreductase [Actinoplanes aureus]MBG0564061.1 FAD-dependent oxidoreductase [Actinoplanes aureus]